MAEASAHKNKGMTLIEVVVVLAIIAILTGILTPIVSNYVEEARVTRAQADVRTIGEAIARFEKDLGRYPMFTSGAGLLPDSAANVVRLEGPGTAPAGSNEWSGSSPTDSPDCTSNCQVDTLANQLLTNGPAYPTAASLARPFKWKGPYLETQEDPWGRKYLVNIINAKSGSSDACFVLSAGPDGIVQTPFNISQTSSVIPSGDDILYRIK